LLLQNSNIVGPGIFKIALRYFVIGNKGLKHGQIKHVYHGNFIKFRIIGHQITAVAYLSQGLVDFYISFLYVKNKNTNNIVSLSEKKEKRFVYKVIVIFRRKAYNDSE